MPAPIDGRTIRWARKQRKLTMRDVLKQAGVSTGFQSEVERNRDPLVRTPKFWVGQEVLGPWLNLLGVTEEFAVGAIPRYHSNKAACAGLAKDVGDAIRATADLSTWRDMTATERVEALLRQVARESARLPRMVLAYVLGLEVETLDAMTSGNVSIPKAVADALLDLTQLPPEFLRSGSFAPDYEPYRLALDLAIQHQVDPDRVYRAIQGLIDGDQPPESRPRPHP